MDFTVALTVPYEAGSPLTELDVVAFDDEEGLPEIVMLVEFGYLEG